MKEYSNKIHKEYLSKNPRKLPGEIICETILQKKSAKEYLKENPRKNIQKKIREEYSKESPLKNIQKQYLSKNPRKLPGEKNLGNSSRKSAKKYP